MIYFEGIKEIITIFDALKNEGEFNFKSGVLQSIGYKEFLQFYKFIENKKEIKEKCLKE